MNARIRAREAAWQVSYHAILALLTVLAALRYLAVAAALLSHRAHTALAVHGEAVADTLGSHNYRDSTRPKPERYARMAYFLLSTPPVGHHAEENP